MAAATTISSTLTTKRDVKATTAVLPERCASTMKMARQNQPPTSRRDGEHMHEFDGEDQVEHRVIPGRAKREPGVHNHGKRKSSAGAAAP